MDQTNNSFAFVLIDENGTLNDAKLAAFVEEVKMAESGVPYSLVSIIGPQSSGKSTLLNHAFGTNFTEMDANTTRSATTHGIWLAKSPNFNNHTLVMDLEGSDGNNRREDDTNFEKQAAVFAFANSDIVLINMWSNNVGCMNAANIPLLRNVFEAMRRLKLHDSKTTLWFVIRDKPKNSSADAIEKCLWKDISQAWDSGAKGTPLSDRFDVKITFLSHYEHKRQKFDNEVSILGRELQAELKKGKNMHPSSGFSLSVQDFWRKIKEDKDLDLPAHRVMVAKVRCEEISDKIWSSFEKDCLQIEDFGKKSLKSIRKKHLSAYDNETEYYDEGVRKKHRKELRDKMLASINSQVKTDKVNPGAVITGFLGGLGVTGLVAAAVTAVCTLGPLGIPIATACGTSAFILTQETMGHVSKMSKPSEIKNN